MHDPVVFFHESWIIDFLALGDGLDERLEIGSLVQKRFRRHAAIAPGTSSAWSICRREKPLARVFSGPSLWLFPEREKGLRPGPLQGRLVHSRDRPAKTRERVASEHSGGARR